MTLFKNCWQNFKLSRNLFLMGVYLHCRDMKKFLKILLLWNDWSDFKIIHKNGPWMNFFKTCLQHFDPSKKEALMAVGYLHYTDLKNSSSVKRLVRLWNNLTEMFLWCPFSKLVSKIFICQKTIANCWQLQWSTCSPSVFSHYQPCAFFKADLF